MSQKVQYIGMAWYHREDYEKLSSIFTDSHVLPKTFDKWLQLAEKGFNSFASQGITVEKVYINPDTFPAWCKARGLDINTEARFEFSTDFVRRKYLGEDV
jgi:hypothetical protein